MTTTDMTTAPHGAALTHPAWRSPTTLATVQGALALDLMPRLDPPEVDHARAVGADVVPIGQPHRRRLERWAGRYVQAVVEIVACDRPASQLVRWCTPRVYQDLTRRAQLVARAGRYLPGQGRPGLPQMRPQVEQVRASFVTPEIAEVSARVRYGERYRALAVRFEVMAGRWMCSALDFS